MKKTYFLKITGRVQGVHFRVTSREVALALHLTGWVMNTGHHVEAVVSGEQKNIDAFLEWAKEGPEYAIVESIETKEIPNEEFSSFRVIRE